MSWLVLFLAGLLEVAWAVGLKSHDGRSLLAVGTVVSLIGSLVLLNLALERLPLGTAYAVWTGIGILGTSIVGVALLGEAMTITKVISTVLILLGIAGLKLSTDETKEKLVEKKPKVSARHKIAHVPYSLKKHYPTDKARIEL